MIEQKYSEPTLVDVLADIWAVKFTILICALVGVLAVFVFMRIATPEYKAQMIIAPADGYALGDYASSFNYERMTSLPFWRPSDAEGVSTDYYRLIHTLRGPSVAEILLKDRSVIAGIEKDLGSPPSAEGLADYLDRHIRVEQIGATPLRRLTYYHADKAFASAFLRKIHLVSDQLIRRDRKIQSKNRIGYLEEALDTTRHPDHRKIITNLLMQQEHVQMLANLDEAYAAIVVEPAATGPKPDWPNPYLFYPAGLLIGAFLGFVFGSVLRARKNG
ncbi:MAG: Wzz/FepE/Etk N-terminal domain-containing protein [Pseudomonadota bacterium]